MSSSWIGQKYGYDENKIKSELVSYLACIDGVTYIANEKNIIQLARYISYIANTKNVSDWRWGWKNLEQSFQFINDYYNSSRQHQGNKQQQQKHDEKLARLIMLEKSGREALQRAYVLYGNDHDDVKKMRQELEDVIKEREKLE